MSHVFREKQFDFLGHCDSDGTYGNVGIWTLFSGQERSLLLGGMSHTLVN